MNGHGLRRWLAINRRSGVAYLLMPLATEVVFLWFFGRRRSTSCCARTHELNATIMMVSMIILMMWMIVGQYHARLMVSARLLRMPGVARTTLLSLLAAALGSTLLLLLPLFLVHGAVLIGLAMFVFATGAGLLVSLFGGSRWQAPIYLLCVALIVCAGNPLFPGTWTQPLRTPMAFAILPLTLWRVHALSAALRSGAAGNFLRYIGSEKPNMLASWVGLRRMGVTATPQAGSAHRPPTLAYRVALGPLFQPSDVFVGILLAAMPMLLSLTSRDMLKAFVRFFMSGTAIPLIAVAVGFVITRVERTGSVLWRQSGELADMALLPGLGDIPAQRRALLHEALLRPLIYYGLWCSGVVGTWMGFAALMHVAIPAMSLLWMLPLLVMMLYAMLSAGVLSGSVKNLSPALRNWAYCLALPSVLQALVPFYPGIASLGAFLQWAALATMAVCLWAWLDKLNRQPRLLCR